MEQGETFRLLAIVADSEDGRRNCAALQNELEELCKAKNCPCPTIDVIAAPSDERVVSHVAVQGEGDVPAPPLSDLPKTAP